MSDHPQEAWHRATSTLDVRVSRRRVKVINASGAVVREADAAEVLVALAEAAKIDAVLRPWDERKAIGALKCECGAPLSGAGTTGKCLKCFNDGKDGVSLDWHCQQCGARLALTNKAAARKVRAKPTRLCKPCAVSGAVTRQRRPTRAEFIAALRASKAPKLPRACRRCGSEVTDSKEAKFCPHCRVVRLAECADSGRMAMLDPALRQAAIAGGRAAMLDPIKRGKAIAAGRAAHQRGGA